MLVRIFAYLVPPDWCYGKTDGWAGLVDLWLGEDAEFAAKSNINRANRGSDGTHGQGNRNHWHHKKLQEEKLKRPLSDIESWRLARVRPNRKDGESEYYGHTGENLASYTGEFQKWNPGTSDPMTADTDERAVVSIGPKSHGRQSVLDSVITPSVSYTRLRTTNPRPSPRPRRSPSTSTAQSILSQRHSAYMEFARQQLFDWNQRVAAVTEHNSRMTQLMFASMATGQIPTMEPPPPPPGPQPVLPTFEQFLAEHYNGTPGTGGSSAGDGATDGSTPESRSPVTPVWRGPGGGGSSGGGASASGDDLGFGDLGFGSGSDAT